MLSWSWMSRTGRLIGNRGNPSQNEKSNTFIPIPMMNQAILVDATFNVLGIKNTNKTNNKKSYAISHIAYHKQYNFK